MIKTFLNYYIFYVIINTNIVQEYVYERTTTNGSQRHGLRPNYVNPDKGFGVKLWLLNYY